jgi:hypothetical protein
MTNNGGKGVVRPQSSAGLHIGANTIATLGQLKPT